MGARDHLAESDKITWHRYIDFYEPYLLEVAEATRILEFGVFHGASMRYLADRFQGARLIGADILPLQDDWPRSDRISYFRLDQGELADIAALFVENPGPYDLVIEDGSHFPAHQRNCLVKTLPHLRRGGVYILEDLHTSHPQHPAMTRRERSMVNSLHLLLAFEHLLATGAQLTPKVAEALSTRSLYSAEEVEFLFGEIASVALYRRPTLPLSCWRCGSDDFKYEALTCRCGEALTAVADSMSAVIVARGTTTGVD